MARNRKLTDFSNYDDLVKKVDDKYSEILKAKPKSFACKKGCHQCCAPNLKVSVIEKAKIKNYLEANPEIITKIEKTNEDNPHKGKRCDLLDASGACLIYPVRPVICRSHGAPVLVPGKDESTLDVCPLNFKNENLSDLDESLRINLSILNTILALVNMKEFPENSKKRVKLSLKNLLK